jgi:hypothetical protein
MRGSGPKRLRSTRRGSGAAARRPAAVPGRAATAEGTASGEGGGEPTEAGSARRMRATAGGPEGELSSSPTIAIPAPRSSPVASNSTARVPCPGFVYGGDLTDDFTGSGIVSGRAPPLRGERKHPNHTLFGRHVDSWGAARQQRRTSQKSAAAGSLQRRFEIQLVCEPAGPEARRRMEARSDVPDGNALSPAIPLVVSSAPWPGPCSRHPCGRPAPARPLR